MRKILTISIAAYNMSKYIRQTLNSLIDEDIIDSLEVFIIDDGGTDETMEIAKEFAERFPDTFFPVHKENGGYGTTVNYSIAHATGKYFKLLDGDDWFDTEALVKIVEILKRTEVDAVITPYKKGIDETELRRPKEYDVLPWGTSIVVEEISDKVVYEMWAITYKTEVIKKSGLFLPEHMLYTDQLFTTIPFSYCKTLSYINESVYCYRIGREGQSASRSSRMAHTQDALDIVEMLCAFYEEKKYVNRKSNKYISKRVARYYGSGIKALMLKPINKTNLNEIRRYCNKIKNLSPDIFYTSMKCGKMGFLLKMMYSTNFLVYWIFKLIPNGVPYKE